MAKKKSTKGLFQTHKNLKWLLPIFAGVFVVFMLTRPHSNFNSQPLTTEQSSVKTDAWKVYTNTELGYSVRYPNNYTVGDPVSSETMEVTFSDNDSENSFQIDSYIGDNLEDYYKVSHAWWLPQYQTDPTNITIDGVVGKKFIYKAMGDTGRVYEMVIVEHNGKAYEFRVETNMNDDQGIKIFRTMLSTFKFLDK